MRSLLATGFGPGFRAYLYVLLVYVMSRVFFLVPCACVGPFCLSDHT